MCVFERERERGIRRLEGRLFETGRQCAGLTGLIDWGGNRIDVRLFFNTFLDLETLELHFSGVCCGADYVNSRGVPSADGVWTEVQRVRHAEQRLTVNSDRIFSELTVAAWNLWCLQLGLIFIGGGGFCHPLTAEWLACILSLWWVEESASAVILGGVWWALHRVCPCCLGRGIKNRHDAVSWCLQSNPSSFHMSCVCSPER